MDGVYAVLSERVKGQHILLEKAKEASRNVIWNTTIKYPNGKSHLSKQGLKSG